MTLIKNMLCEYHSPISECIHYIYNNSANNMPLGKYLVNENGIYVLLQEYYTKNPFECEWESHKKYVDFQVVLSGEEDICIAELSHMQQGVYDDSNDFLISFGESKKRITLRKGMGVILFPEDVHMPCLHSKNKPSKIRKAVFKIPVECFGGQTYET